MEETEVTTSLHEVVVVDVVDVGHAIKDVDDNYDMLYERPAAHAAGHDEAIDYDDAKVLTITITMIQTSRGCPCNRSRCCHRAR